MECIHADSIQQAHNTILNCRRGLFYFPSRSYSTDGCELMEYDSAEPLLITYLVYLV